MIPWNINSNEAVSGIGLLIVTACFCMMLSLKHQRCQPNKTGVVSGTDGWKAAASTFNPGQFPIKVSADGKRGHGKNCWFGYRQSRRYLPREKAKQTDRQKANCRVRQS